jgi:hypothetical protein
MYGFNQSVSITSSAFFIGLALLVLSGCSGGSEGSGRSFSERMENDAGRIYDVALTPLLVGLGLDELSVAAGQVARVKHAVRCLSAADCKQIVRQARSMSTAAEILELSRTHAQAAYPELFL